jgi:hypothetical protein
MLLTTPIEWQNARWFRGLTIHVPATAESAPQAAQSCAACAYSRRFSYFALRVARLSSRNPHVSPVSRRGIDRALHPLPRAATPKADANGRPRTTGAMRAPGWSQLAHAPRTERARERRRICPLQPAVEWLWAASDVWRRDTAPARARRHNPPENAQRPRESGTCLLALLPGKQGKPLGPAPATASERATSSGGPPRPRVAASLGGAWGYSVRRPSRALRARRRRRQPAADPRSAPIGTPRLPTYRPQAASIACRSVRENDGAKPSHTRWSLRGERNDLTA